MCGNRRISLHFLLLPFRLPPPPAAVGEEVRSAGRAALPRPGGDGDNGAPEPQPSAAESPGLCFPPIRLLLVPKTHRSHMYPPPPALGLWAALKPWGKTHPERGEGSEPPRDHCPRQPKGSPPGCGSQGSEGTPPWHHFTPNDAAAPCRSLSKTSSFLRFPPSPHPARSRPCLLGDRDSPGTWRGQSDGPTAAAGGCLAREVIPAGT